MTDNTDLLFKLLHSFFKKHGEYRIVSDEEAENSLQSAGSLNGLIATTHAIPYTPPPAGDKRPYRTVDIIKGKQLRVEMSKMVKIVKLLKEEFSITIDGFTAMRTTYTFEKDSSPIVIILLADPLKVSRELGANVANRTMDFLRDIKYFRDVESYVGLEVNIGGNHFDLEDSESESDYSF